MTKKEIIKLLNEELDLFVRTEEETSLGELYLSEVQFKEAEILLTELKNKRNTLTRQIEYHKAKIHANEGAKYVELPPETILKDTYFEIKGDLIFLDPRELHVMNCVFESKLALIS